LTYFYNNYIKQKVYNIIYKDKKQFEFHFHTFTFWFSSQWNHSNMGLVTVLQLQLQPSLSFSLDFGGRFSCSSTSNSTLLRVSVKCSALSTPLSLGDFLVAINMQKLQIRIFSSFNILTGENTCSSKWGSEFRVSFIFYFFWVEYVFACANLMRLYFLHWQKTMCFHPSWRTKNKFIFQIFIEIKIEFRDILWHKKYIYFLFDSSNKYWHVFDFFFLF